MGFCVKNQNSPNTHNREIRSFDAIYDHYKKILITIAISSAQQKQPFCFPDAIKIANFVASRK